MSVAVKAAVAGSGRNLELLWLLRKLTPDFKTIVDFRQANGDGCQSVLREFNQLCRQENLLGGELLARDGTQVKADHVADQNWPPTTLEKTGRRPAQHRRASP